MHSNSLLMIVLIVTILSLTCSVEVTYGSVIAHWRFEEGDPNSAASGSASVVDSSGHNLHGTPVNGPIYRADVAANPVPQTGTENTLSLDFNGTNEQIFIPDDPMFQLTQSLTVEAWINVRSTPVQLAQILFRGDDRGGLDPYFLTVGSISGGANSQEITFLVQNAENTSAVVEAALPNLDEWTHVAGTLDDATGDLRLYLNGTLAAEDVTSVRPFAELDANFNPGLGIGNTQFATHRQYFDGLIDEVRISDVALNPSEFLNVPPDSTTEFTWKQDQMGDWASSSNWSPAGGPPDGPNDTAIFADTANITGPTDVSTAAPVTVNRIQFSNTAHNFVISGLGSVNMSANTEPTPVNPSISVQGTHQFQVAVNLLNDTNVTVASDSTLTFNNAPNLMSHTLTKTGAGTMAIRDDLVLGGGTVDVQEGTLSGDGTIGGDLINDGGTISPGNLVSSLSGVPEPTSLLLLAFGGLGWALGIRGLRR